MEAWGAPVERRLHTCPEPVFSRGQAVRERPLIPRLLTGSDDPQFLSADSILRYRPPRAGLELLQPAIAKIVADLMGGAVVEHERDRGSGSDDARFNGEAQADRYVRVRHHGLRP